MTRLRWIPAVGVALLTLSGSRLKAQVPISVPPAPRPAAPAASVPPPVAVSPAKTGGAAPARSQSKAPATYNPVRPQASPNAVSPDSVRPAAPAPAKAPPSNAVAQCVDGSYVVAPNDPRSCASHRGIRVVLPHTTAPSHATSSLARAAGTTKAATPANATPPAGSTMRCKDGTYLSGPPTAGRCDANGGLAAVLHANGRPVPAPPPHAR
ncbi:MAG TPA: hypothetical protein VLV45_09550 [Gemmatimonadales bacterium]|nr:hypothetical protein [Gemmatimonadales bacterium]